MSILGVVGLVLLIVGLIMGILWMAVIGAVLLIVGLGGVGWGYHRRY